jgi:hypothetical protein
VSDPDLNALRQEARRRGRGGGRRTPPTRSRPPRSPLPRPSPRRHRPFRRLFGICVALFLLALVFDGWSYLEDLFDSRDPIGVSRYKGGGYRAEVTSVRRRKAGFAVRIVASGARDLRRPGASCVEVGGRRRIRPRGVRLRVRRPGRYAGTLKFAYRGAGAYRFRYSCRRDYTSVWLFRRG